MPDGFKARCKECMKNKIPSTFITPIGENKTCAICNVEKDLVYFNKRSDRHYLYEAKCRECDKKGLKIELGTFKGDTRRCYKCLVYKSFGEFTKSKQSPNGVNSICKQCAKVERESYRDSIPEHIRKERKREEYLRNRDAYIKRAKRWRENNKERAKKAKTRNSKNLRVTRPLSYLKNNIRSLIKGCFKRVLEDKVRKTKRTSSILCCEIDFFRKHIETQFEYWMNWDNYGHTCENMSRKCSWDLDHIIPVSCARNEEELYLLNHWSNFQPLCSFENRNVKRDVVYPCCNLELNINTNMFKHETI